MADPVARTALAAEESLPKVGSTQVRLEELPFGGKINLRGRSDDRAFAAAAARGLGDLFLPMETTSSTMRDTLAVLWLGPDEWLISCPADATAGTLAALGSALEGIHHSAVDVSDNWTVLRLSGGGARRTLSKLVTVDLHPRGFRPGDVLQTPVAKSDAILHLTEGTEDMMSVDILIRRSFAAYVWKAIANAAEEFAVAV